MNNRAGRSAFLSAHMLSMEQLIAELESLLARHASSPNPDFYGLLGSLNIIVQVVEAAPCEYHNRHILGWDSTWLDLEESQVAHVPRKVHPVERRPIARVGDSHRGASSFPLKIGPCLKR
ncbi:hypothetical protein TV39_08985 [Arthrobacter sp. SPG23]|nr:hypothetical protein TV39_08985 [Arthrobacter sp. SPG23]